MPRWITFLRAINVGGHTVKMEHLRKLFEALEFRKVETFIASGNVIFEADVTKPQAIQTQIEHHLRQSLGYEVATFLRAPSEVATVASYKPFPVSELEAEGTALYVAFLSAAPTGAARDKLMGFRSEVNDFHIHQREVYWLCRRKMSESAFSGGLLEKTLGMPATLRNSTTVKRLATKYAP